MTSSFNLCKKQLYCSTNDQGMHINYESIKTKAEKKVCAKHKEAAKLVVTATGIGFKEDCCCLEFEDEIMNFVADLVQKEVEKHIL